MAARKRKPVTPFHHKLVLNQWLLSLFGVAHLNELAEHLRDINLEGLDECNVHKFHRELLLRVPLENRPALPDELLLEYDQNIVRHTRQLNENRMTHGERPITWKYFQYLVLLFAEIYLDRYFSNPASLAQALNESIAAFNDTAPASDAVASIDTEAEIWPQLNKVAFWMATGSGKTLLMHVNILQFKHSLEVHRRTRELNRIILLTPNAGLSRQHLLEFEMAGIPAKLFDKDEVNLFARQTVEIIDIHKLRDESRDKTIDVEALEGNNLVLVDEGHRGASSGAGTWMRHRNTLCEKGFSFEYSATFAQAVKKQKKLGELYARNILFNYSYFYFYEDGFGKEYKILNLKNSVHAENLELYLVTCLLSFFQQQRFYNEAKKFVSTFQIEKPLWVFVGSKVTVGISRAETSDIVNILKFLDRFVSDRANSIQRIEQALGENAFTASNHDLFSRHFEYLQSCELTAEKIFSEIMRTLFNAPDGGKLHIENISGVSGEIALRVGTSEQPFGVINVGDDAKLMTRCEEAQLDTGTRDFSASLFEQINQPQSAIQLLIGSKKFTEGWNSWRVSTMGLMHVGQSEGTQIIQLFGRGVRLKGHNMSLKRSSKISNLPEEAERPEHSRLLETLGVFGIHANYMEDFRKILKEEGTEDETEQIWLPVIKNLGSQKLKTLRLKETINGVSTRTRDAFRLLGPVPSLRKPKPDMFENRLRTHPLTLNWYPKVQVELPREQEAGHSVAAPNRAKLAAQHTAFINLDRIVFELERFKSERGWYNMNLTRENITALLQDDAWYTLLIPEQQLRFDSFERVREWEEIALALLKKYMRVYYLFCKSQWEAPHLEYRILEESDSNFPSVRENVDESGYCIEVKKSEEKLIAALRELKKMITTGELREWSFKGLKALRFDKHLYHPLLCLERGALEISPVPLNSGEQLFVEGLRKFHDDHPDFFKNRDLYLMRNLSRGRGVGFFEAGNFYPDFMVWLVAGKQQQILFVDPKGLVHHAPGDLKIQFHKEIKKLEQRMQDNDVRLESFILSNTKYQVLNKTWDMNKSELEQHNVLFQEDGEACIRRLLEKAIEN